MEPARKILFWMGCSCLVGAICFFLLFGFTPLKQNLYRSFLFSGMEELGYKVVSSQHQGSSTELEIAVPEGQSFTEEDLQQLLARAHKLALPRYERTVRWGTVASMLAAVLFLTASLALDMMNVPARRKKQRQRKARPFPAPSLPVQNRRNGKHAASPRKEERAQQTWEDIVSAIQGNLLLVKDLSVRTELEEEFVCLVQEKRKRRPKAEHLLWRIIKAAQDSAEPVKESNSPSLSLPFLAPNGRIHGLQDVLAIDHFLGKEVDPLLIKVVLLGFLRPGNQVPFFEGSYTSKEQFRRGVGLPAKELDKGLRYLRKIGLVHQRRRKVHGRILLSLATKARTSPAREIAQAVLQARRSIEQEGVLVH